MRIKYFVFAAIFSMILISCEDSFSPKGTYDERYSLNCIIRGDSTFHVATSYKSYDVPGINPYENNSDSFIDGAFIRMWRGNDEIFIFRDSSIERTDKSRYTSDIKYYYINNFVPREGDSLDIEALLPNGRRLRSSTVIPEGVKRNKENSDLILTRKLSSPLKTNWLVRNQDQVYLPKLVIDYFVTENGVDVRKKAIVPWKKLQTGNDVNYIYPSPSRDYSIEYELDLIKEAMADISINDSEKSKYAIISLWLELSIFDVNLSTYYFTVGLNDNSFSAGLDEGDYSNIENGFGIFGSFFTQQFKIEVEEGYVNNFGYVLYE